jgi:arsenite oxidase large subunit
LLIGGKGGIHHIWGRDHFKTTLNAAEFNRRYKWRTDLVKAAVNCVPAGGREGQIKAIMDAIAQGGLFSVDIDIVPTKIASCAHVVLPGATSGETNLTSMNGERRMRLTEKRHGSAGQRPAGQPDRRASGPGAGAAMARGRQAGDR